MSRQPTSRALGPLVFALVAGACGSDPGNRGASVSSNDDDADQAIAASRACIAAEPARYASVWGSSLDFDRVDVHPLPDEGPRDFLVSIPEVSPRGLPMGLDLKVDLSTGECHPLDME